MASRPSRFSFFDPIRWWGRLASARVALVDRARDDRYTYAELDRLADAWQDRLASLGVGRGDRVGTLAGNRAAQVALLYACWRSGAALVPLNWRLTATELSRIVANARPKVIVGEDRFQSLAEAAGVTSSGALWEGLDVASEAPRGRGDTRGVSTLVTPDADDAALILYTSGSTGAPKGAVLPHRQVFYNAVATATGWELGPNDIAPISTPFFHTGGWNVFATPLWQLGGRIVLFDHFDPASYLHGLSEERCTVALTVPTQIIMMLESSAWGQRLPSLRFFISGGAPCPLSIMERVRAGGFAMKEGFGLTECGPNCFTMPTHEAARRPGSVGWPMPFLDMRLVRDDGPDVLPNEVGELLLRGPQMFGGYFDDPIRTAEAIDGDGWLHTGDLAARDEDGAYRICGRRKEMFISGGENVYPGEVESALMEHPAVAEVAVIGVADAKWGEVGCAYVVVRRGQVADTHDLTAFARARLAGYKVPKSVVVLEELPRLGSGKIDRSSLAARGATGVNRGH